MLVYIILFLFLLLIIFPDMPQRNTLLVCSVVFMFLIGMFRSMSVGTDNLIYSETFYTTTWESIFNKSDGIGETDFEIGYSVWIVLFRNFICDEYIAFMSVSFFITMSLFLSAVKRSKELYLSLFLFYALSFYFLSFNIMRQMMGCALILSLLPFFVRKQIGVVAYSIWIFLISFGFHKSLIVFFLVILIVQTPIVDYLVRKKTLISIAVFSIFVLAGVSSLQDIITSIREFFILMGNERYAEYLSPDNLGESSVSFFSSFIKLGFLIFLIVISPINILKSFSFIGLYLSVCISNILGSISVLFTRISTNLEIMFIFFIPFLYVTLEQNKEKKMLIMVTIGYSTTFFLNYLLKGYAGVVPYNTFLLDF